MSLYARKYLLSYIYALFLYGKDCLHIYAAYKKEYVIRNENIYPLNNVLTGTKAIEYYTSADSWLIILQHHQSYFVILKEFITIKI